MGVTADGAKLGNLTLAINVIVMQFFQFFSFFIDGFAYCGEALVGLRAGEKNYLMLRQSVRRLLYWGWATGIIFSFFYFSGIAPITSLLTDSKNVLEGVLELTFWVTLIPVVSCWAFIFDGFYVGITDTFKMMISSLIGGIVFFGIISLNYLSMDGVWILSGNRLIWTAFLCYLLARGIYLYLMWPSTLRNSFLDFDTSPRTL